MPVLAYLRAVVAALRRHSPLLLVLAGAVTLRVFFVHTYPWAFFFPDSRTYVESAVLNYPGVIRPYGYSYVIKPFVHAPIAWLALAQHVTGVLVLVAAYAFLLRRRCRPWVAALAVVPFALDARVVTVEHYILAETLFVAATAAGLFALAWREKAGWFASALGGSLLAFAAITRTVGLPVLALAGVYLLVRRVGVLRLAAFVAPVLAILGSYLIWYHQTWGVYAFGQYQGRFLYARVMPIADCTKLRLTDQQRLLCMPDAPKSWTQRPDSYIWSTSSPANRLFPADDDDPILNEFATTVIKQRPLAYLDMVADQTWWHLEWRAPITDSAACLAEQWNPPVVPGDLCQPRYYIPAERIEYAPPPSFLVDNPGATRLHAYGKVMTTPGPLFAVGVLAALAAAVWRPRRRPWREAADALLFTGAGFGLIVGSVATSLFDYRYAIPAALLIPVGLALAGTRLTALARRPTPPAAEAPAEDRTDLSDQSDLGDDVPAAAHP